MLASRLLVQHAHGRGETVRGAGSAGHALHGGIVGVLCASLRMLDAKKTGFSIITEHVATNRSTLLVRNTFRKQDPVTGTRASGFL